MDETLLPKKITPLSIPVPPAPLLEDAVGYRSRNPARYIALWWTPLGDEALLADGLFSGDVSFQGYLAYVQHNTIWPSLHKYNLGSSEDMPEYCLLVDLQERRAFAAPLADGCHFLASQWSTSAIPEVDLTTVNLDNLIALIENDFHETPQQSFDEIAEVMRREQEAIGKMVAWLDNLEFTIE